VSNNHALENRAASDERRRRLFRSSTRSSAFKGFVAQASKPAASARSST
jgi:hypothetical protein